MNLPRPAQILSLLTAGILSVLTNHAAQASVTIDFTAQTGQRNVIDHFGNLVENDGGEVRVGVIDSGFDIARYGDDLHRLARAWTPLGSAPIREVFGQPSRFSARTVVKQTKLSGKKLYLWVLTTTNGGSADQDFGNVRSHGLFSSTAGHWVVPSPTELAPRNSTILSSSQIDQHWLGETITESSLHLGQPASEEIDYDPWKASVFSPTTPADMVAPLSDPDGDGLVNLLEQFTGRNPLADEPSPFSTSIEADAVEFLFERSKDVPAAAAKLYISNDLDVWAESDADASGRVIADLGNRERIQIRIPLNSLPAAWRGSLFIRLDVTL
ncbi:MAG: hypothetical protein ACR2RV_05910 [Verrucomicrobiales bacterium]